MGEVLTHNLVISSPTLYNMATCAPGTSTNIKNMSS